MKSDLIRLAKIWAICLVIGFIAWLIVLYFFLQPILANPDLEPERQSIIFHSIINYFHGPFAVEIRGTIGRNSIHQTRISGFIILSLIPTYFLIKKQNMVKKILLVAIPILWAIHPFLNLYLWSSGN